MSAIVRELVRIGIAPMLEPLGFAASGDRLTRKRAGQEHEIRFVADELDPERAKIEVILAFREPGQPEQTVPLTALVGKRDRWWVVDVNHQPKRLAETLLVGLLDQGLAWFG